MTAAAKRIAAAIAFAVMTLPVVNLLHAGALELPEKTVFKKTLENGLTILAEEVPSQDLVSVDIIVNAGASLEGRYLGSGISHFVEHMVFKGTASRGVGEIEREIESYGGVINGDVSQDLVHFYAVVPSGSLAKTLALLKDMLLNASFKKEEFEKERAVILKEINLTDDEPQSRLFKVLNETAYINHAYRYPVIGYRKTFEALTREELIDYYRRMYVPNRMVVSIVGNVRTDYAAGLVETEFKDFRSPNYEALTVSGQEPLQMCERRADVEADINLAYLALAFHSTKILDKDLFAMDVLSMILGRGEGSRLNKVLVKDRMCAHSVSAWNYTPRDPGLFVVNAIADKDKVDAAEAAILSAIEAIKKGDVKEDEVISARRKVLADFIFSLETVEETAKNLSYSQIMTGDTHFYRRYIDGIQQVTKDDISSAAVKYLKDCNLTVARLLPRRKETPLPATQEVIPLKADGAKRYILPNGIRLVVRENRSAPVVAVTVSMLGGLLAEDEKTNGISALTAYMLLCGTSTRGEDGIKDAIESSGGSIAPFSGLNSFGVTLSVLKVNINPSLDILKDILTASVFPSDALRRAKSVTTGMIREEDDDIFAVGDNALRRELFPNHPYGMRELGTKESVDALGRDDVIRFYKNYVVANNMTIAVSGDIDAAALSQKLTSLFKDLKAGGPLKVGGAAIQPGERSLTSLTMAKEESLVMVGARTVSLKDPDRYAIDVLDSVLSGHSGRLFRDLRQEKALAYTLGCSRRFGIDGGYISFYAATTPDGIGESVKALESQIEDVRQNLVTDEELKRAKSEIIIGRRINMQANAFFSSEAALAETYGMGYETIYGYADMIDKVTKEDLKRVASKYLDPQKRSKVIIKSR